ncbi:MAG TPA: tyrosine-type recombinase/integrase [Acidimicrobiales bacterium]|nr:tyrosine-type recombinase/integrase [Acidimicrobiales bacterium]
MASVKRVDTSRGARYRVRWRDEESKSREEWFRTRAAADAKKREVERDEFDGLSLDPRPGRRILNDYFDEWVERRLVKGRPLRPSTKYEYRKLWRLHVAPTLGTKQLRAVTVEAVNKWHDALVKDAGPSQAAKAYRTVRAVFRTAEADEIIRSCPCRIRGGGQEHPAERPLVETALVLELADAIGPRLRLLVLLAGFASLRTGEALGLRRRDFSELHATLTVVSQSQNIGREHIFTDYTKSDAGRRTLKVKSLVPEILEHLAANVDAGPDALLFVDELGRPYNRGNLSEFWRAAVAAAGAPKGLRIHDLRHHAATMTARTPGVTTKELMARIGHSTHQAALRYQHAAAERDEAVDDYLGGLIQKARGAVVGLDGKAAGTDGR